MCLRESTGGGQSAANYSISYLDGTLSITPYALSVTVDNATRVYGEANPVFTGTVTGARAEDNISVSYSTGATETSPVGNSYAISAVLNPPANSLTNYAVTVLN